jgi:hypothetical protein
MAYLHNYYSISNPEPAYTVAPILYFRVWIFWLILNMRLAYFGPEEWEDTFNLYGKEYWRIYTL